MPAISRLVAIGRRMKISEMFTGRRRCAALPPLPSAVPRAAAAAASARRRPGRLAGASDRRAGSRARLQPQLPLGDDDSPGVRPF